MDPILGVFRVVCSNFRRRRGRSLFIDATQPLEVRQLLVAPQDPVVITDVEFPNETAMIVRWDPVDGATMYEGWLSSALFDPKTLINGVLTPDYFTSGFFDEFQYDLETRTAPGNRVRLWVRALNDDGAGPWSAGELIQVPGGPRRDQVQFTDPQRAIYSSPTDERLNVSWEPLDQYGAEIYDVWVNHNGQRIVNLETTETTFQSDVVEDGVYTVWVRARSSQHNGPWSQSLTIALGGTQPQITGPIRNEAPVRPEFTWSAGAAGVDYQLWVQNVDTGVVINQSGITGTAFTPDFDLPDGVYSVWVRQTPDQAPPLPWSSAYRFAVGTNVIPEPPVITLTENFENDSIPPFLAVFAWEPAANAVRYELLIVETRFGDFVERFVDIEGTSIEVDTTNYAPVAFHHRAWLRSIGANGEMSAWSQVGFAVKRSNGEVVLISSEQ